MIISVEESALVNALFNLFPHVKSLEAKDPGTQAKEEVRKLALALADKHSLVTYGLVIPKDPDQIAYVVEIFLNNNTAYTTKRGLMRTGSPTFFWDGVKTTVFCEKKEMEICLEQVVRCPSGDFQVGVFRYRQDADRVAGMVNVKKIALPDDR